MAGTALTIFEAARELDVTLLEDIPSRNKYHRMEIRSSSSNRLYIVSWDSNDRQWGCTCPGWMNARNGHFNRKCKHITTMMPTLERVQKPRQIGSR